MLIGIDVGNTNITVGLFADGAEYISPLYSWRFTTKQYMTADEIAAPILAHLAHAGVRTGAAGGQARSGAGIHAAVVACVVPALERPIRAMLESVFGLRDPLFIDHTTDSGLEYDYPQPAEIGADRIVNGAAGIALYGAPLLIADFGTATTFCCVSREGKYLGGLILPGVDISLQALTSRAAKLSSVSITQPERVVGKSTGEGMVSGIYYQTLGALDVITRRVKEEMREPELTIIATGGLAALFSAAWTGFDAVDQDLTLKGLKLIHERRSPSGQTQRIL